MEFVVTGKSGQSSQTDGETEEDLHSCICPHAWLLQLLPLRGKVKLDPFYVPLHCQGSHQQCQHDQERENHNQVSYLHRKNSDSGNIILFQYF